jgi:hypothetical protein
MFETRRRTDTRGAVAGIAVVIGIVIAAAVAAVWLGTGQGRVVMAETLSITALPLAVSAPVMGVVIGVADAGRHGNRAQILAGAPRVRILLARLLCCMVAAIALVVCAVVVACTTAVGGALLSNADLAPGALPTASAGAAALAATGSLFGAVIGGATRSVAVGVVIVMTTMLVVDTALAVGPSWWAVARFSSLQNALIGDGPLLPALSAFALWILLPACGAVFRTLREES